MMITALASVPAKYRLPMSPWLSENSSLRLSLNSDIKKVCPKPDDIVITKPKQTVPNRVVLALVIGLFYRHGVRRISHSYP